jgi:hypothetical protein
MKVHETLIFWNSHVVNFNILSLSNHVIYKGFGINLPFINFVLYSLLFQDKVGELVGADADELEKLIQQHK